MLIISIRVKNKQKIQNQLAINIIKIKMFCKLKKWVTESFNILQALDSSIDYMSIIYFSILLTDKM